MYRTPINASSKNPILIEVNTNFTNIQNARSRNLEEVNKSATDPLHSRSLQEAEREFNTLIFIGVMRESVSQMIRDKLNK